MKHLNRRSIATMLIPLTLGLQACGGGSSGDDETNVSGIWHGDGIVSQDTCAATARGLRLLESEDVQILFTHTVNQNESAVQLQDQNGVTYIGNLVGDEGFSVDAITEEGPDATTGASCQVSTRIRYGDIRNSRDVTADVVITRTETCSDGFTCSLEYGGTASRANGNDEPVAPTPDPEEPSTPSESCLDLQELEYTGDGGCGISQTQVRVAPSTPESNAVILEPLGANGATSFMLSTTDGNTATAVTPDLEIQGATGYQCSMTCESDLTFVLSCFQEGGTTCQERF